MRGESNESVARCLRDEQSCDVGLRAVTILDDQLGKNIALATVVNRIRAGLAACLSSLEGFGTDRCSRSGHSWN